VGSTPTPGTIFLLSAKESRLPPKITLIYKITLTSGLQFKPQLISVKIRAKIGRFCVMNLKVE
jgi:hypothetical protein